jgi:hypothetical protein
MMKRGHGLSMMGTCPTILEGSGSAFGLAWTALDAAPNGNVCRIWGNQGGGEEVNAQPYLIQNEKGLEEGLVSYERRVVATRKEGNLVTVIVREKEGEYW